MSTYRVKAGMHCIKGQIAKIGDVVESAVELDARLFEKLAEVKAPKSDGATGGTGDNEPAGKGKGGRKAKGQADAPEGATGATGATGPA